MQGVRGPLAAINDIPSAQSSPTESVASADYPSSFPNMSLASTTPFVHAPSLVSMHKATLTQTKLPFQLIPCEQWLAQEKQCYYDRKAENENHSEQLKQLEAQKKLKKRDYERCRKRAQRKRQKELRASIGITGSMLECSQTEVSSSYTLD
jgi:hypothetical protein